jgi:hypothetical protein
VTKWKRIYSKDAKAQSSKGKILLKFCVECFASPHLCAFALKLDWQKSNLRYYFDEISECESAIENFPRHARRAQRPQPVHHLRAGGKISQRHESEWKPTTARGRRMAALLEKGKAEREPLLDDEGMARELVERQGRFHWKLFWIRVFCWRHGAGRFRDKPMPRGRL